LLFKRWKSRGRIAELEGSSDARQLIRVWGRLLAVLVEHWLMVGSAWGDARTSVWKACAVLRGLVDRVVASFDRPDELERVLTDLSRVVARTCRRNRRKKPGTFELLNDPSQLDFCLT
jgi:hypothetical protein